MKVMITFVNLKAANLGDALRCVQEQTSRTRFPIHDDGNSAKDLAFLSEFRKQWHVRSLSFRGPVSCAQLSREGFPGGLRLWVVVTVIRSCQSPSWTWQENSLHVPLHDTG